MLVGFANLLVSMKVTRPFVSALIKVVIDGNENVNVCPAEAVPVNSDSPRKVAFPSNPFGLAVTLPGALAQVIEPPVAV